MASAWWASPAGSRTWEIHRYKAYASQRPAAGGLPARAVPGKDEPVKPNLARIPATGDARAEAITQPARTPTSQSLLDSRLDGCLRAGKQRLNLGSDPVGHRSGAGGAGVERRSDAGAQPRGEPLVLNDLRLGGCAAPGKACPQAVGQPMPANLIRRFHSVGHPGTVSIWQRLVEACHRARGCKASGGKYALRIPRSSLRIQPLPACDLAIRHPPEEA
jgi:hypothetical protein